MGESFSFIFFSLSRSVFYVFFFLRNVEMFGTIKKNQFSEWIDILPYKQFRIRI